MLTLFESIYSVRLAVSASLCVLIWMVQLLIYPSFKYFEAAGLAVWHRLYTRNMTFIVAPLMILQGLLTFYSLLFLQQELLLNSLVAIVVVACWITTFMIFIPLHVCIDKAPELVETSIKLTSKNWIRVLLWSLIFGIDIVLFLKS